MEYVTIAFRFRRGQAVHQPQPPRTGVVIHQHVLRRDVFDDVIEYLVQWADGSHTREYEPDLLPVEDAP